MANGGLLPVPRLAHCVSCLAVWMALLVAFCLGQALAAGAEADLPRLLQGVQAIAAPGVPGPLCVAGNKAFAVVVGRTGGERQAAVVAASRLDKGRVVAFGHTGYFDGPSLEIADTGTLMQNAMRWASGRTDRKGPAVRVAVVHRPQLAAYLKKAGFAAEELAGKKLAAALDAFDVVAMDANEVADPALAEATLAFVRSGKGIVMTSLGWGWLQLHPGKNLVDDHPGNRFLAKAGIAWADGYLQRTAGPGFDAGAEVSPLVHAGRALDALVEARRGRQGLSKAELAQASLTLGLAIRTLPSGPNAISVALQRLGAKAAVDPVPLPKRPLKTEQGLERILLTAQLVETERLAPEKVRAHLAAEAFPGPVPKGAERLRRGVSVDTNIPGWHSTGLYAAPGEVVEVELPREAAGKGLFVRIGCHSDALWDLPEWRRAPAICLRRPLSEPRVRVASGFGGLIYVEVPERCSLGRIDVAVRGAVEAPFFVLGTTRPEEWRKSIRSRPAPWAELATDRVIVSVPSRVVRWLDNPEEVLEVWNKVLDACADLATRPLQRERPERYVADEQISAGYMHSGYPIMTHLDAAESMVSKERLLAGNWGLFHEMGHNHQSGDWTFDGAGEVTVNLFSLYVCETVCRLKGPGHPAVAMGKARDEAYRKYAATGPDFNKWKSDPFLALTMYVQLREGFGWDAFRKVFSEYRTLPAAERPKTDDQKRDQWLVRLSRTVNRNLGPFFQAWGVPTSESARKSIADLPAWMPEGFPPGG